jgi:hypothetical protein
VVRTSNERGAGTDADPYLELVAATGKTSGRRALRGSFTRGAIDQLELSLPDVGPELTECVVGHDGRGEAAGWHLEQVGVELFERSFGASLHSPVTLSITGLRLLLPEQAVRGGA